MDPRLGEKTPAVKRSAEDDAEELQESDEVRDTKKRRAQRDQEDQDELSAITERLGAAPVRDVREPFRIPQEHHEPSATFPFEGRAFDEEGQKQVASWKEKILNLTAEQFYTGIAASQLTIEQDRQFRRLYDMLNEMRDFITPGQLSELKGLAYYFKNNVVWRKVGVHRTNRYSPELKQFLEQLS